MKTRLSTRTVSMLALTASALVTSGTAMAAPSPVTATILADNGSLVVLEQGGSVVQPQSVAGNWPRPKTFTFDIDNSPRAMRGCRIHVIAWGDGSVAQGVMAHFAGSGGAAFTGQASGPLNTVTMSSVTHGGGTAAGQAYASNSANAAAIIAGAGGGGTQFTSQPVVSGGIPGTWGPVNLPANMDGRGDVRFLWTESSGALNANPNNYRVLSMPCSAVVRQEKEDSDGGNNGGGGGTAVLTCSRSPVNPARVDMSSGQPGWTLKLPNGSPSPIVPTPSMSPSPWATVPGAQWVGPQGAPNAAGLYVYERKVRVLKCPNGAPATITAQFRADNVGTLTLIDDSNGSTVTSMNQFGTANYGFLPGSLSPNGQSGGPGVHSWSANGGLYTLRIAVRNSGGPTGMAANVVLTR